MRQVLFLKMAGDPKKKNFFFALGELALQGFQILHETDFELLAVYLYLRLVYQYIIYSGLGVRVEGHGYSETRVILRVKRTTKFSAD